MTAWNQSLPRERLRVEFDRLCPASWTQLDQLVRAITFNLRLVNRLGGRLLLLLLPLRFLHGDWRVLIYHVDIAPGCDITTTRCAWRLQAAPATLFWPNLTAGWPQYCTVYTIHTALAPTYLQLWFHGGAGAARQAVSMSRSKTFAAYRLLLKNSVREIARNFCVALWWMPWLFHGYRAVSPVTKIGGGALPLQSLGANRVRRTV